MRWRTVRLPAADWQVVLRCLEIVDAGGEEAQEGQRMPMDRRCLVWQRFSRARAAIREAAQGSDGGEGSE